MALATTHVVVGLEIVTRRGGRAEAFFGFRVTNEAENLAGAVFVEDSGDFRDVYICLSVGSPGLMRFLRLRVVCNRKGDVFGIIGFAVCAFKRFDEGMPVVGAIYDGVLSLVVHAGKPPLNVLCPDALAKGLRLRATYFYYITLIFICQYIVVDKS